MQLKLREQLRRLRDEADATLAVLFMVGVVDALLLEYAGDRRLVPTPLPRDVPPVPSLEILRCADGDDHDVVLHAVRIGRGWPALGLAVVDGAAPPPALLDVVEDAGARIEASVVRAIIGRR